MKITNLDWRTKTITIKDRTVIQRYLPRRIPTTLAAHRAIAKYV